MIFCKQASHLKLPLTAHRAPQQTFRAPLATVRGYHNVDPEDFEGDQGKNDFIVSILRASPSIRDTKSYLASFGPRKPPPQKQTRPAPAPVSVPTSNPPAVVPQTTKTEEEAPSPIISSILDPVYRRTALVKIQGPFTDRQLESVAKGMVYLEKLGLVSVVVVDHDDWTKGEDGERAKVFEEAMRVTAALERQGARARPLLNAIVRLGPVPVPSPNFDAGIESPEAHTSHRDLVPIRSALRAGEIPVLTPVAMDSFLRSVRVDANDVISALVRGMVNFSRKKPQNDRSTPEVDLTPLRLMIINREGGVPSYARSGYPHLLVNLDSEYSYIRDTFHEPWQGSHPSALSNLKLARTCLSYMPATSSAVVVSHRSPTSLIANLITNKPAVSSSLPHALLQGNRKLTPHTPTFIRRGLPIRVVKEVSEIDRPKLKLLLEQSFRRELNETALYARLEQHLDFVIVAGDYAGVAIVTNEGDDRSISYLDKFAVHPDHQGDGTVDFLWVALHDESYGVGLPSSVNPHGGKEGRGEARDLVWRSRAENPINKWYFERSSGHLRSGKWVFFWCDAEARMRAEAERYAAEVAGTGRRRSSPSYVEPGERGRLDMWANVIKDIPSVWSS